MSDTIDMRPGVASGPPAGTKTTGGQRVDFKPDKFDQQIAAHGLRMWWSRAAACPCQGNAQTDQADPNCSLCSGKGWLYFLPDAKLQHKGEDIYGNTVELNTARDGVSVQGILTSTTADPQVYEKFGQWIFGTARLTTSLHNRIGYRDRLVLRDSSISYSQLFDASGAAEVLVTGLRASSGLWSPLQSVNLLRSLTTTFKEGEDFKISDTGTLVWLGTPPDSGTKIALHGEFIPTVVVMDHVYAIRDTLVSKKVQAKNLAEQFRRLPVHAIVKLDFLMDD